MKHKTLLIVALTTLMTLSACGMGGDAVVDQSRPIDDPESEVIINFWHCLGHEKTKNLEKVDRKSVV